MAFRIGNNCKIDPSVHIDVKEGFIGDGAVINFGARIEGERVEIGREAFIDRFATIGGGSCFDPGAFLRAGDWFHMGMNSQVNLARGVTVGHEVGCGIETKIFTHGAYLDAAYLGAPVQWAPVTLGDSVWLPNAWVNPGVTIGSQVVVAARSLVNDDIPAGSLAGGVPAKILKANYLPRPLLREEREKIVASIIGTAKERYAAMVGAAVEGTTFDDPTLILREPTGTTVFHLKEKWIDGPATSWALVVKDQLRRNGIRFRFSAREGKFFAWPVDGRGV